MAIVLTLTLALGGCNRSPQIDETNASVSEIANKVRAANNGGGFVQPGEWQSQVTVEDFAIPGMPADEMRRMRAAVAQNQQQSFTTCLTKEDAQQPKGQFFTGNEQCRYDHFTMGGGKIDAAMRCPAGQGMTQVMTMTGSYGRETYDMRMTMTGEGAQGPAAQMKMTMRILSKRIGVCKADGSTAAG